MSTSRTMPGGWTSRDALPKGANGRGLCRWCNLEVPKGRFTFCSDFCVEEWKLRTDPGYLRDKVFDRDHGVCAICATDCLKTWHHIKRQRGGARARLLSEWGVKPKSRQSLWDADHIVPVAEGGGECDLSNLRTLCLKCHRTVTAALRKRLLQQIARTAGEIQQGRRKDAEI